MPVNLPANYHYTTTVPDAPNDPADDQPLMQINTASIGLWADVDHIGYNQGQGGVHNVIHLLPQTVSVPVIGSYTYLFSKTASGYIGDEVLYTRGGGGVGEVQLTVDLAPVASDPGFSYLPGGILIQWGSVLATAGVVNFPKKFKQSTSPFTIQMTFFGPTVMTNNTKLVYAVQASDDEKFQYTAVSSNPTTTRLYWLAIGQAKVTP